MKLPILYSFRRCPYAIRARLAIAASSFHCQLREVFLRNKPVEMINVSPKATVPVLVLSDDTVIDQSLDIMMHVLAINDPSGLLYQEKLQGMVQLIEASESAFKPHLDRYKYSSREENPQPEYHRARAGEFLYQLESQLTDHANLFGRKQSLADIALLPFVRQFAQTDRSWFDRQPWPNLQRWLVSFENSGLRSSVMNKYPAWKPDDQPLRFP